MKVILTSFIAMLGFYVMPSSTLDKHLTEDSAKDYLDCICCAPESRATAQILAPAPRREHLQTPAPTLTPTPPPVPQSEIVQSQQPLSIPNMPQPLSIPQQPLMLPQAMESLPLQSFPVQLVSASSGCHSGGSDYYNYRRFGGRLRRRG